MGSCGGAISGPEFGTDLAVICREKDLIAQSGESIGEATGGAGLQADLKTLAAFGVYGLSATTAITVQDTSGVSAVVPLAADLVEAQIRVAEGEPRYTAVYEIESPEVLTSEAWSKAVEAGRWPSEVRPYTRNRRHVLRKVM